VTFIQRYRKVLKGGLVIATDGNCTLGNFSFKCEIAILGPPLGRFVDTFLGISGPNYGLCVCQLAQTCKKYVFIS
jgi:hypothetical protein